MSNKQEPYELNEKDIDTVLNILKRTDPENATPEMAIEILETLQGGFHEMSHKNPKLLEEIKKELDKQKKSEN